MKLVINECFGGFAVDAAVIEVEPPRYGDLRDIARDDPRLIAAVEGGYTGGKYSRLVVVEIPDGIEWHIDEYDGLECVHEAHRSWTSRGEQEFC